MCLYTFCISKRREICLSLSTSMLPVLGRTLPRHSIHWSRCKWSHLACDIARGEAPHAGRRQLSTSHEEKAPGPASRRTSGPPASADQRPRAPRPPRQAPANPAQPTAASQSTARREATPSAQVRPTPDAASVAAAASSPSHAPPAAPSSPPSPPAPPPLELLAPYGLFTRQHEQLDIYLDYLLEVNQHMNLTAVRDKGEAWGRHVVDSLALLPAIERRLPLPPPPPGRNASTSTSNSNSNSRNTITKTTTSSSSRSGGAVGARTDTGAAASTPGGVGQAVGGDGPGGPLRVIDVGTGAGLPGMVLAVARPHWKVTLLDSLRKRCDFLREAAARAGLTNVEVVWCRAEEGGQRPELRQSYDLAVARAVAEARVLAELCLPFVRVGGLWVAAKGPDPEAEVSAASNALGQLGGRLVAVEDVESRWEDGRQRTALVVAKAGPTPAKFPRQAGTPNKKPL